MYDGHEETAGVWYLNEAVHKSRIVKTSERNIPTQYYRLLKLLLCCLR